MATRTEEPETLDVIEPTVGRTWAKTAQTRQAILDAARDVFLEHGFADASIAHVVEKSGFSVGSIYHHFGGKAELFTGLYLTHQGGYVDSARTAVAALRASGEEDGLELFMAGARAYLESAWRRREVARLFLSDPGPAGFASMRRARSKAWIRQNAQLLDAKDDAVGRVRVSIMTAVIGDAAREITLCDSRREAKTMIEASLIFLRRIAV
ncbi:MAG: TetR family transcriptional regulator [Pseudonocardiales bacterium]|nr:TetR family transcriptional regulator [Pseudonocardiales bacterium]